MGIIYKFTSPSGKAYIGQSEYEDLEVRKGQHIADAKHAAKRNFEVRGCTAFWRALIKYGPENFEEEILLYCPDDELNDRETEMIKLHNTLSPNGYNLNTGGGVNRKIAQETKDRISKNTKVAMKKLGTKLKRTIESQGCPLYVGYYKRNFGNHEGYRIRDHPQCAQKDFSTTAYGTLEECKQAAIDYINKLDSGEIEHKKPQKKDAELPPGIVRYKNGFKVRFVINKVENCKLFIAPALSLEENYALALKYRNSNGKDAEAKNAGHTKPKKKDIDLPSGIFRWQNGFKVQFSKNNVKYFKSYTSSERSIKQNYALALEFRNSAGKEESDEEQTDPENEFEESASDTEHEIDLNEYDSSDSDLDS